MKISQKGKFLEFFIAILLILIGVGLRLLPHSPNFTPIAAIALFGGVYFSKKIALILPLTAMLISDTFIGFYEPKLMAFIYGSFLLCVVLGFWVKKNKRWQTILGTSILGAFIFFILTNLAVWIFTPWYVKSFSGLIQCYLMALPFLRNTLLGDIFYTAVFFGVYEMIDIWIRRKFKIIKTIYEPIIN